MTRTAARHRSLVSQAVRRQLAISMAVHAEGVESRFCAQTNVRPLTAMTRNTAVYAGLVDEVVVADKAIDGAMSLVGKLNPERLRARHEGLKC